VERLSQGLALPLTLISAPAGFGKTTLVSEWRASNAGRDYPLACLSLETDDNDPTRFLTYLVAALGTLKSDLAETALGMLQSPQPPASRAFLTGLINDLGELDRSFALVLDDYHVISATPVHEALGVLLDHLPRHMHLVLLTRADPPLPLARVRARDQQTPNLCGCVYSRRKGIPRLSSSHCARRKRWRGDGAWRLRRRSG
jgi:LuxR family maltose regulon positive regulatory protein